MSFTNSDLYLADMKDLLDDNWVEWQETPKPQLIVVNDPNAPEGRFDLNSGDVIIIKTDGSEQIKYLGNIQYYNRFVPISLDIRTKEDRQRLHNLYKMIRIILFDQKWDFPNYQLIKMINYQEFVEEELNIWKGVLRIQLENAAISVDT